MRNIMKSNHIISISRFRRGDWPVQLPGTNTRSHLQEARVGNLCIMYESSNNRKMILQKRSYFKQKATLTQDRATLRYPLVFLSWYKAHCVDPPLASTVQEIKNKIKTWSRVRSVLNECQWNRWCSLCFAGRWIESTANLDLCDSEEQVLSSSLILLPTSNQ